MQILTHNLTNAATEDESKTWIMQLGCTKYQLPAEYWVLWLFTVETEYQAEFWYTLQATVV